MIECENCGANLTLDDEKCPYCDAVNPDAVLHVQQLKLYKEKYEKINSQIQQQTRGNNIRKIQTTIAFAMAGICLACLILSVVLAENARNINEAKYSGFKFGHFIEELHALKEDCLPYQIASYGKNIKEDAIFTRDGDMAETVKKTNRYVNLLEKIRDVEKTEIDNESFADYVLRYSSCSKDIADSYFDELDNNLVDSFMYYRSFTNEQAIAILQCESKEEILNILEEVSGEK